MGSATPNPLHEVDAGRSHQSPLLLRLDPLSHNAGSDDV